MTTSVEHGTNKSDRIPPLESGDRLTRLLPPLHRAIIIFNQTILSILTD